ncbi:hypothetical protein TrST_g4896 [Triparma strigata]|uniref:F-box domain-containing protein n=1 Tax=Triparma strigata TaxID=1606541 RepID=A0A9W7E931_9STRA|nr:hypothetical protein TrST_g4896 [Triparma strigata]
MSSKRSLSSGESSDDEADRSPATPAINLSQGYPPPLPLCDVTLGTCLSYLPLENIVALPVVSKSFYAAFYSPTPSTNILHPMQVVDLAFRPRKSLTSKATGKSWFRLLHTYSQGGVGSAGGDGEKENRKYYKKKAKIEVEDDDVEDVVPEGHVKCSCGVVVPRANHEIHLARKNCPPLPQSTIAPPAPSKPPTPPTTTPTMNPTLNPKATEMVSVLSRYLLLQSYITSTFPLKIRQKKWHNQIHPLVKCLMCSSDIDLTIQRSSTWKTDDAQYTSELNKVHKMSSNLPPPPPPCSFNLPPVPLPTEYEVFGATCAECDFKVERLYVKCKDCGPWCTKIGRKGPNFMTVMCKVEGCFRGVTCGSHASNVSECDKCHGLCCGSKCMEEVGRDMWCVDCYDELVEEDEDEDGEKRIKYNDDDDEDDDDGGDGWGGNEFEEDY